MIGTDKRLVGCKLSFSVGTVFALYLQIVNLKNKIDQL